MSPKTVVIVLEENERTRGGATVLDDPEDARRFIEGLLEKGFERRSIRVLAGREMDVLITQRPVVTLLAADKESKWDLPVAELSEDSRVISEQVPGDSAQAAREEWPPAETQFEREPVAVAETAEKTAYTRDGVRFSSAFSRAY